MKNGKSQIGLILGLALFMGMVIAVIVMVDRSDLKNEMALINPPQEILDGAVAKIVVVQTRFPVSEQTVEVVTVHMCSGETWTPTQAQVETVIRWIDLYAQGCP